MSARTPILRRIALGLARHAAVIPPSTRSSWAEAIRREVEHIEDDRAALGWAIGSVLASYAERIRGMDVLRTLWAGWALALLALWRALVMFFAPSLTIAYHMHELGIAEILGSRTPGDDYHRFIPLMDAMPSWLLVLWVASGLFYLLAGWRLLRNRRGAFALVAVALLLEFVGWAAGQLLPEIALLNRQAFTFAHPNIRRDYLVPAAQLILLAIWGAAVWCRDHQPRARPS
jgi:hypothetical protein